MQAPSSSVRLTVPIAAELSERISVLAYNADLTRAQWVRRALEHMASFAVSEFARLADEPSEEWYAAARAGWTVWRSIVRAQAASGQPGGDVEFHAEEA